MAVNFQEKFFSFMSFLVRYMQLNNVLAKIDGKYNETAQNEPNVEGAICNKSPEADESKILCLEGSGVKFQNISTSKPEHSSIATSSLASTSETPKGRKSF